MIPLTKPVRRLTRSTDRKGNPLVVSLEPGDIISFRPKGKRRTVSVYAGHCYALAQIVQTESDYKDRMKVYNEKRKYTKGLRRPKRHSLPFSRIYFSALNP